MQRREMRYAERLRGENVRIEVYLQKEAQKQIEPKVC